ncbi:MAG: type II toxin-antitoxin system HicB family antitoxin [Chitinophagaceae bacterium]
MTDVLQYKNYYAGVHFSAEDEVFHGKIIGINDLVNFEGNTVKELKKAFHEAVDDYLETCEELGKEPEKTYKGSFNVRIPSDLHRQAARYAALKNMTLNDFVRHAIDTVLSKPPNTRTTNFILLFLTFIGPALIAGFLL